MVVKGRVEVRVERRCMDYFRTVEEGNPRDVGRSAPRPPDRRDEIRRIYERGAKEALLAVDRLLDKIWMEDDAHWRRRIEPFLRRLSAPGSRAFAGLVKAGCQPDALAQNLWKAAGAGGRMSDRGAKTRADAGEVRELVEEALGAVQTWLHRRTRLDAFLRSERLLVSENEPGTAELKAAAIDLQEIGARHLEDLRQLQQQLDERRNPVIGHARVRVSQHVREVTGSYHDLAITLMLNDLLEARGYAPIAAGALRAQRHRRAERLIGRSKTRRRGGGQGRNSDG